MSDTTTPKPETDGAEEATQWRCFHCDEAFTDPTEAMEHFGDALYDTPACQLTKDEKGLVGLLREAHFQLRRYQDEDSASYREFYRLGATHSTALMREEEKGYARGLRDGRIESVNSHDTLKSENALLREQVKELREALRPFAETADLVPPGWEDDHSLGEWALCLDVADLRRARDLMEKTNG